MARLMLALMLYFLITAHKASCHTLSKVFLKSVKTCSNGNVFSPTEFGTSRTLVVPALVSDGERVVVPGRDRSGMDILSFVAVIGGVSWAYL